MKPKIYPCFRYHKDHPDGKIVKSEQHWEKEFHGHGWVDSPAKIEAPVHEPVLEQMAEEAWPEEKPQAPAPAPVEKPKKKKYFGKA